MAKHLTELLQGDRDSVQIIKDIALGAAAAQRDYIECGAFSIDEHRKAGKSEAWLEGYSCEGARILADPAYANIVHRKMVVDQGLEPLSRRKP